MGVGEGVGVGVGLEAEVVVVVGVGDVVVGVVGAWVFVDVVEILVVVGDIWITGWVYYCAII